MLIQAVVLWVVVAANTILLGALLKRIGGLGELFGRRDKRSGDVDELIGVRLPPLGVLPCGSQGAAVPQVKQNIVFDRGSLVIFAAPRCVASRMLLRSLQARLTGTALGFPIVIVLVGAHEDVSRLAAEFPMEGRAVELAERRFAGQFDEIMPFAISLGVDGAIAHAGVVDNEPAFRRFAEASGSAAIREWCAAWDHSGSGSLALSG